MNEVIRVPFSEDDLGVVESCGGKYVPLKPLCKAIGLNWVAQFEKIHRDPALKSQIVILQCQSNGGMQSMITLPLGCINEWLIKIPASRYSGKLREKIIRYQRQCYQAHHDPFNGIAINPDISIEQAKAVSEEIARQVGVQIDAMLVQHRRDMAAGGSDKIQQDVLREFFGDHFLR